MRKKESQRTLEELEKWIKGSEEKKNIIIGIVINARSGREGRRIEEKEGRRE